MPIESKTIPSFTDFQHYFRIALEGFGVIDVFIKKTTLKVYL